MLAFSIKQYREHVANLKSELGDDARYRLSIQRPGLDPVELFTCDLPDLEPGEYHVELHAKRDGEKEWTRVFAAKVTRAAHGNSLAARGAKGATPSPAGLTGALPMETAVMDRAFTFLDDAKSTLADAQKMRDGAALASIQTVTDTLKTAFQSAIEEITRSQDRNIQRLREEIDDMQARHERKLRRLEEEHDEDRRKIRESYENENQSPGERMFNRGLQLGETLLSNLDKIPALTGGVHPPAAQSSNLEFNPGEEPL